MRRKISYAVVVAVLTALALSNPVVAQAARKITSGDIKNNTILSKDIKDGTVKGRDVRNNSIRSKDIHDASLTDADLLGTAVVVASARALGNGRVGPVRDVVYVKRAPFDMKNSRAVARQIADVNARLVAEGRPCALVGFGRWGSADPWLGIPVAWDQVSAARVIVEAARPGLAVEMSQGAHFFHNLLGLNVPYLSVPDDGRSRVDWDWLESLPRAAESDFVCHAVADRDLMVEVDGWSGRGRIMVARDERHG